MFTVVSLLPEKDSYLQKLETKRSQRQKTWGPALIPFIRSRDQMAECVPQWVGTSRTETSKWQITKTKN